MYPDSLLIADPDLELFHNLSFFVSSDLPGVEVTRATSVQQTVELLSRRNYSIVIVAARLIQDNDSLILQQKWTRHALVPFLQIIGREDIESACGYPPHPDVFDMIMKPVDPTEALFSIRIALWQARFLSILTQQECEVSPLQRHLEVYPHRSDTGGTRGWVSKRVDDALRLIRACTDSNDLHRLNLLLLNLAASVGEWRREHALDRLERMRGDRVGCVLQLYRATGSRLPS